MTFEEAVRKAIKTYWQKTEDFDGLETSKGRKYTKEYFDGIKSSVLNKEPEEIDLKSKKKKSTQDTKGKY